MRNNKMKHVSPFGELTETLLRELEELNRLALAALDDSSLRSKLPVQFADIDWDDEDEIEDSLFEAVVEAVAMKHGLDDEATAQLGFLADSIL